MPLLTELLEPLGLGKGRGSLLTVHGIQQVYLFVIFEKGQFIGRVQGNLLFIHHIHQFRNQFCQTDIAKNLVFTLTYLLRSAPLIFIATALTHLLGGSAGREGAAIQLGGSIGNQLGRWIHLDEEDRHVIVMCGMSAAFSAVFGTPMAAAVFAMEVVSVGVMYYAALLPCGGIAGCL